MTQGFPIAVAVAVGLSVTLTPAAHADPVADAARPSLFPAVDAAAARLQTADPVAAAKWVMGGPIEDPIREQAVIRSATDEAGRRGADPDAVAQAFRDQIDATVAVEYDRFSAWKLDPALAPAAAPALADTRAVIDGLNRTLVIGLADGQSVRVDPSCSQQLTEARDAVAAARTLDDVQRRALVFATRSYCG